MKDQRTSVCPTKVDVLNLPTVERLEDQKIKDKNLKNDPRGISTCLIITSSNLVIQQLLKVIRSRL